jgi:hypothetical protein
MDPESPSTTPGAESPIGPVLICDKPKLKEGSVLLPNLEENDVQKKLAEIKKLMDANDRQGAINKAIELFDIKTSKIPDGVQYNDKLDDAGSTGLQYGKLVSEIGPNPFESWHTPGYLVATIAHEMTHANQYSAHGRYMYEQNRYAREVMAHDAELANAKAVGLSDREKRFLQDERNKYYNLLSDKNQQLYEQCQYWDMDPHPRPSPDSGEGKAA